MSNLIVQKGLVAHRLSLLATVILGIITQNHLKGEKASYSLSSFAGTTNESEQSVRDALDELHSEGFLKLQKRDQKGVLISDDGRIELGETFHISKLCCMGTCTGKQQGVLDLIPERADRAPVVSRLQTGYDEFGPKNGTLELIEQETGPVFQMTIRDASDGDYFKENFFAVEGTQNSENQTVHSDEAHDVAKRLAWKWFDDTVGQHHDEETATGTGEPVFGDIIEWARWLVGKYDFEASPNQKILLEDKSWRELVTALDGDGIIEREVSNRLLMGGDLDGLEFEGHTYLTSGGSEGHEFDEPDDSTTQIAGALDWIITIKPAYLEGEQVPSHQVSPRTFDQLVKELYEPDVDEMNKSDENGYLFHLGVRYDRAEENGLDWPQFGLNEAADAAMFGEEEPPAPEPVKESKRRSRGKKSKDDEPPIEA